MTLPQHVLYGGETPNGLPSVTMGIVSSSAEVDAMPTYTAEDYWNLPDGERAELIDGRLYAMTSPSRTHQRIAGGIYVRIANYIESHHGPCEVLSAPFAVNLGADDKTLVEPDVMVICDPKKSTEKQCVGAPDLVVEVVSPSSTRMDYVRKYGLYSAAGVREYWIVDPAKSMTTVYNFADGNLAPVIYPFSVPVPVGIYPDLSITVADLLD